MYGDGWDIFFEVVAFIVAVALFVGVIFGFAWLLSQPGVPWCNVVTTTGEIETQNCPDGFNEGDRIYWDNEKKTYAKVG